MHFENLLKHLKRWTLQKLITIINKNSGIQDRKRSLSDFFLHACIHARTHACVHAYVHARTKLTIMKNYSILGLSLKEMSEIKSPGGPIKTWCNTGLHPH